MENGKQMRITPEEIAIIKATFSGNEALLKLMRKIFLPEYDPNAPLGQVIDLWMSLDFKDTDSQQREVRLQARNSLILHVEQQLIALRALCEAKAETEEEKLARIKKDSAK